MDKDFDLRVVVTDHNGVVMEDIKVMNDSPAEQTNVQVAAAIVRHIENRFEVLDD